MAPYLPPYTPPAAYDRATGTNTGDLGFMRLPVERTVGGVQNNLWNPQANPFPGGFTSENAADGLTPDFNPFLQGYMSGGEWKPYLPDKIVLGQRQSNSGPVGQASQWINGQQVNVGSNNYAAGTNAPAPYQYKTAPGDARMEAAAPFTGFGFGEQGKPGYKFMAGTFDGGKFYQQQPESLNPPPNKNLGILQPWNPALNALQQSRIGAPQ